MGIAYREINFNFGLSKLLNLERNLSLKVA